jgi:hypothetical protein
MNLHIIVSYITTYVDNTHPHVRAGRAATRLLTESTLCKIGGEKKVAWFDFVNRSWRS